MVAASIFLIHGFIALYAFLHYKKEGVSEGLLAVAFFCIIFAVGWTIATMLVNLLFLPDFFIKWYYQPVNSFFLQTLRKEMNRNTISLIALTAEEYTFYYFYLRQE